MRRGGQKTLFHPPQESGLPAVASPCQEDRRTTEHTRREGQGASLFHGRPILTRTPSDLLPSPADRNLPHQSVTAYLPCPSVYAHCPNIVPNPRTQLWEVTGGGLKGALQVDRPRSVQTLCLYEWTRQRLNIHTCMWTNLQVQVYARLCICIDTRGQLPI